MTTPNDNNPTKEILASFGIFNNIQYASLPYASDNPNNTASNTGINTTTTTTTVQPQYSPSGSLYVANLTTSSRDSIDDMLIFNDYIHYYKKNNIVIQYNTRSFLQKSNVAFNMYSTTQTANNNTDVDAASALLRQREEALNANAKLVNQNRQQYGIVPTIPTPEGVGQGK